MSFVVFEGIDGVGKTTQADMLEKHLKGKGYRVLRVREPGGTRLGERIREILLDPSLEMDGWTETLLYFASRRELCRKVLSKALKEGTFVIAERFTLSTYVYQGYLRGIDIAFIEELERKLVDLPRKPFYILLDLPPELAVSRKVNRDRIEREPLEFFVKLREFYLELARLRPDVSVISAFGEPEDVFKQVLLVLRRGGVL